MNTLLSAIRPSFLFLEHLASFSNQNSFKWLLLAQILKINLACSSILGPRTSLRKPWAQCPTVKDNFWQAMDSLSLTAASSFKDMEEDDEHHYVTFLLVYPKGVLTAPWSILRIRLERVQLPWTNICLVPNPIQSDFWSLVKKCPWLESPKHLMEPCRCAHSLF